MRGEDTVSGIQKGIPGSRRFPHRIAVVRAQRILLVKRVSHLKSREGRVGYKFDIIAGIYIVVKIKKKSFFGV
jgi:hypothetical protein